MKERHLFFSFFNNNNNYSIIIIQIYFKIILLKILGFICSGSLISLK